MPPPQGKDLREEGGEFEEGPRSFLRPSSSLEDQFKRSQEGGVKAKKIWDPPRGIPLKGGHEKAFEQPFRSLSKIMPPPQGKDLRGQGGEIEEGLRSFLKPSSSF